MQTQKTAIIQARVQPEIKKQAEAIFSELGINASTAITLFYTQIIHHKGIPFDIKIPNQTTLQALSEDISTAERFESIDDLMKDLHA